MASNSENHFLIQYEVDKGPHEPSEVHVGLQMEGQTYSLDPLRIPSLDALLGYRAVEEIMSMLLAAKGEPVNVERPGTLHHPIRLWTPVSNQEVWAAGVTYKRSEQAREAESNNSNLYTRVYSAARPELFFKAIGSDVSGHGHPVGIRYDATWSVPEPELVVVLNSRVQVVGFSIGNDMSSRDIEGENALYLPQAKVYERSCAIGPRIWLQPGYS